MKRERAIARVRCSAESARAPFYKEAPTVPAPRRAHECPMSSAGAVRCCCAFLRARLAPLTTAHRQGLEKLGKGSKPGSRLAHHPRPSPMSRIACSNGHALTGNGQLHMPEPQLQLLRSDNTSTCPGGRVGCRLREPPNVRNGGGRQARNRARASGKCSCPFLELRSETDPEKPTRPKAAIRAGCCCCACLVCACPLYHHT